MANVRISYHNTDIYESSSSFNIKLCTEAKYLDADVKIFADLSQVPVEDMNVGTCTCEISNTLTVPTTRQNIILYTLNGNASVKTIVNTHNATLGNQNKYLKDNLWWSIADVTVTDNSTIISGVNGVTSGQTYLWVAFDIVG